MWVKIKPPGDRRICFCLWFLFRRVPFWVPIFDPEPFAPGGGSSNSLAVRPLGLGPAARPAGDKEGVTEGAAAAKAVGVFHVLKSLCHFPLVGCKKRIYHWKCVFPGGLIKWTVL